MNPYNLKIILLAGLVFQAGAELPAQEAEAAVKISTLSLDGRPRDLYFESAGKVVSIYAFKNQRSQTIEYRGPETITFFRKSTELDENGEAKRIPAGSCRLLGDSQEYLLIFSKDPSDSERYRIFAMNEAWSTFPPGAYRFLNLSEYEIALKLDEEVHRIKPQNFTDISGNFAENSNQRAIMVSLPEGKSPLKVFEGFMYHTKGLRMLYLISPKGDQQSGQVQFTAIPQKIPNPVGR